MEISIEIHLIVSLDDYTEFMEAELIWHTVWTATTTTMSIFFREKKFAKYKTFAFFFSQNIIEKKLIAVIENEQEIWC